MKATYSEESAFRVLRIISQKEQALPEGFSFKVPIQCNMLL
jgi:hypothetical protein